MAPSSFTGRPRKRTTSRAVRVADVVSRWLITAGGVGTIFSVFAVAVFLIWVAMPLFTSTEVEDHVSLPLPSAMEGVRSGGAGGLGTGGAGREDGSPGAVAPLHFTVDEHGVIGWMLLANGVVRSFRLDDGALLDEQVLVEGEAPTAVSLGVTGESVALGFADGSVRFGTIGFETSFLDHETVPREIAAMAEGELAAHEGGIVQRTPEGQFRLQTLTIDLADPLQVEDDVPADAPADAGSAAVVALDHVDGTSGPQVVALTAGGRLLSLKIRERRNLLTGRVTRTVRREVIPYEPPAMPPRWLLVTGLGDNVLLAWPDGSVRRYDIRDADEATLAQELDVVAEPGVELTALQFLIGRSTLLVGSSDGGLSAWFRVKPDDAPTPDGALLVETHRLRPAGGAAITALASSRRTRLVAFGDAGGAAGLVHVTSERLIASVETGGRVLATAVGPKDDLLAVLTPASLHVWELDVAHPEATLSALFTPVWYEGYEEPLHVWQSSSGTDEFEMKLGLYPLIFGTLKATFYSMLFGAPLALLAAIYTSEFLSRRLRSKIKPTVELMASLPSVVLGFLAALVVAPFVENIVPTVLTTFAVVPLTVLLGAHLWQLLPHDLALRLASWRLVLFLLALPVGIGASILIAPLVEAVVFAGDFKGWADGRVGSGTGAWFLLFLPLAALLWMLVLRQWVRPALRSLYARMGRRQTASLEIGRFLAATLAVIGMAWLLSALMTGLGFDLRGSFVDTYVQRNALVVGFIMGFAIIPIIYTIAEDALSSVPEHLRAASLAAGATPLQTAQRIIIPTAMSGLFSALMIGLGRAVGETMIVLMAAGNTPVMDWNIFNGFRTLSANIAVELPEAVRNSTHYRTLFLAAFVLFLMTFVVNAVAEVIRLRFRKRAFEL